MTRTLRPRATAAISVAPVAVTDLTCAMVLGLEPRVFRDVLVKLQVRHVTIGRRKIATVADVLQALERASVSVTDDVAGLSEDAPRDVDALLLKLGRSRTGMRQSA